MCFALEEAAAVPLEIVRLQETVEVVTAATAALTRHDG
jgi:hypothetical protein